MIRITLPLYCQVTVALTALVIYHAHSKYEQFYPTGVYLATAKHALLTITNFAIVLAYLVGKLVIKLFLEKVHERELDLLNDRLKTSITDTILALTIFREHFNAQFVFLLLVLLFFQVFHWLTKYRVEYLEHSPYDFKKNIKLFTLLTILLFFDVIFLYFAVCSLFEHGINAMMLFSLEYGLLLVSVLSTMISFFINIEGIKREGRWDQKGLYILYLEFFSEGIKTIMYAMFFIASLIHISLPIHIIRQLFISFRTFYRRFQDLLQYQSIMNERFQDATDQELENSDKICIVCREDMTSGKKLPCGHILHLHCLRSWLERQQTCPICRALVIVDDPNRPASLLNRIFRRRPPVQQPVVPPVQQPAANAVPVVAQQQIPPLVGVAPANAVGGVAQQIQPLQQVVQQHLQQLHQQIQQQQAQVGPVGQNQQFVLPLFPQQVNQHNHQPHQPQIVRRITQRNINRQNRDNNTTTTTNIQMPAITTVADINPTIDPMLLNDRDVVLHIMAMQNHIQFLNSQLDYIKNYLVDKNNINNNIDSGSGSNGSDNTTTTTTTSDNNNNNNNNNDGEDVNINKEVYQDHEQEEEIIAEPVTKNDNNTTTTTTTTAENIILEKEQDENDINIPTATAVEDEESYDPSISNSPQSIPSIHEESSNEQVKIDDFTEQLRKRVAKHRDSLGKSDE